jgi:hypothetical protein
MFYFNEVSLEKLTSDLGKVPVYIEGSIRKSLSSFHHIVYRDGKPYCIFYSEHFGYTHMEYFGENAYFPGVDYEELGPLLESDEDFKNFLNNEWIKKEFSELRGRMYRYFGLYTDGKDCYIEVTNDPYWWEGYMMWKILQSESNEIRRALKYKGKLPKVSLGCGPSLKVEYRRK